jgi:hypothetical protein
VDEFARLLSFRHNLAFPEQAMSLAPGTRLGYCEIIALIGAGGMDEVYRAKDTRLNREVNEKAQALASLNHPNIDQIHGLEDTGASAGAGAS